MTLAELAQRAGLPGLARWAGSEGRAAGSTLHDWDAGEGTETAIRAAVREACRHTHRGEIAALARAFVDERVSMLPVEQRATAVAVWGRTMAWTFAVVAGWENIGADDIMLDAVPDDEIARGLYTPPELDRRFESPAALAATLTRIMGETWRAAGQAVTGGYEVAASGIERRRFTAHDKTMDKALARLAHDPRLARLYHSKRLEQTGWRPCAICEPGAMPFRSNPPRPAPTATLFSPAAPPPIYFASGSNDAGEIEGFADIGQPVGITADRCAPNCLRALRSVAGRSATPVFLDSGAFSEVTFPSDGPPVVVAPISDDEWRQRLDLYVTLAHVYGPRLYAVAPDRVGDQAVTLERMRRFAPEVRSVAELGAHILVPLQRGPMALADFHRAAADALGLPIEATVPAIPSKKRATDPDALLDYLRTARPRRIHFLGLGRDAPNAPRILEAVQRLSPGCQVFLDSVLVRAHVGWGKGGETPRRYTAALATVREELVDRTFEDERGLPGYTDNVAFLGEWASRPMLERIAAAAMIPPERRAAFYKHPTQFAQAPVDADLSTLAALGDAPDMTLPGDDPRWWDLPWFEAAVDAEWHAYRRKVEGTERKRRAVERAWGDPEE